MAELAPLAARRSRAGGIYYLINGEVERVTRLRFASSPRFLVYGDRAAPPGYSWVSGGDYNSVMALRSAEFYQQVGSVSIPRRPRTLDVTSPDFGRDIPEERYMDESQLSAYRAAHGRTPGYFIRRIPETESRMYAEEISIYQLGPNLSGQVLVSSDDLLPDNP